MSNVDAGVFLAQVYSSSLALLSPPLSPTSTPCIIAWVCKQGSSLGLFGKRGNIIMVEFV